MKPLPLIAAAGWALLALLPATSARVLADEGEASTKRAELPVKEATVFKDGHALLLRAGSLPVQDDGSVVLDRLPHPVLGTFWSFVDEEGASLQAVRAGRREVHVKRTALEIQDLLRANVGGTVALTDVEGNVYRGRILGFPTRSVEEEERTSTDEGPHLPARGKVVLLGTEGDVRAMPISRIRDVVFRGGMKDEVEDAELRDRLTLSLSWKSPKKEAAAVGYVALEDGLRWIPSYRIDLLDGGRAHVRLQATIVNDLTALEDADLNLVIGVPTFAFEDTIDPIALQGAVAQVAGSLRQQSQIRQSLSNAIQSQSAGWRADEPASSGAPPEVLGAGQNEDLYVFHVAHVTVAKGERLVVPVADVTLPYADVYTLDVPFSPPPEVWPAIAQRVYQNDQAREQLRREAAPRVVHEARLHNDGPHPLTTAPALLFRNGRVLAQGMMTYTSVGNSVDIPITAAVDVHVKKTEHEDERTPDAERWNGDVYTRVDMAGTLALTNYRKEGVHLEVTRSLLGRATSATHDGDVQSVNALEDSGWTRWNAPVWWPWYSWPYWWYHFNTVSQVHWELDLDAGASIDLGYAWSYYWR